MELFNLLAKLTLDTNEFDKGIDKAESSLNSIETPDTKLGLDTSEFDTGLEKSEIYSQGFGESVGNVFKELSGVIGAAGITLAITGIVNGLKEAISLTAETADGIEKGSSKLGISQKAYQEWDHALRQSGTSIDVVKKGIMQFQAAIKAADPATMFADAEDQVDGLADATAGLSGDAYEALRDLGLLSRLQAGEFKNAEELMNASLIALAGFEGSTDDRGILVRKLFGKGGDELNPLLDEGVEGVKALLTEASDLGLIMSDEEIENAVAYGDAVENLQAELNAIKTAFVQDIIPVLTSAVQWLTDFMTQLNPRLQQSSIFSVFEQINKKTIDASNKADEAAIAASDLIDKLKLMGDYWTLDTEGKKTWDKLAQEFIDNYPQFEEYIDKENKKIKGNTDIIKENIRQWSIREKQRLLNESLAEKREAVTKLQADALDKEVQADVLDSQALGKQQTAFKEFVRYMTEGAGKEYGASLFGGREITMEDFFGNQGLYASLLTESGYRDTEAKNAYDAWQETTKQAEDLRTEAAKMNEEAEKAMQTLEEYQEKLSERIGLTEEDLKSVSTQVDEYTKKLYGIPRNVHTVLELEEEDWRPHAIGSAYIPYDNYPALLHRGEKILTSTEARQQNNGVDLSSLGDSITAAIRNGMNGVTVNSYLNGRSITAEVNRNNTNDLKSRRYRA